MAPIRWTLVCGVMLFVVGLVSLCIGHVGSDLEWYSHRIVNQSWYHKRVIDFTPFALDCVFICDVYVCLMCWLLQFLV